MCVCVSVLQLPKLLELIGLGYTSWFVYRYLLFKVRPREGRQPSRLTQRAGGG